MIGFAIDTDNRAKTVIVILTVSVVIKGRGGEDTVGAGWALIDPKTAIYDTRNAANVDAEGVVESYGILFTMIRGCAVAAGGVAPKADYALF